MEWNSMKKFIDSLREQSANTNAPVSLDKGQAEKKAKFDAAQKATDPVNATAGGSEAIVKQGDSAETVKEAVGSTPKTAKEKKLAAMGHPKDKITHKDVLIGRGVLAKEEVLDELSRKTLASYVRKSVNDAHSRRDAAASFNQRADDMRKVSHEVGVNLGRGAAKDEVDAKRREYEDKAGHHQWKALQRGRGADKALNKLAKEDVDQTIDYKTTEVEIKESTDYADYFKAALSVLSIDSPLDLAEEDRADFYALIDECFNTKDDLLFLEAWMRGDVQDKMDMHKKAGNKVSDVVHTNKAGQSYHSFVVTEPSGKRTRHIFHGNSRKLETMSPAPKSKEAHEAGEDEDDK